jgi:phosphatidate phosphatase APP1
LQADEPIEPVPRRLTIARAAAVFGLLALSVGVVAKCVHDDGVHVVVYDGYATSSRFFVGGRVLEDDPVRRADAERAWLANLRDAIEMLESDEVPEVRLRVEVGGEAYDAKSNEEGVFLLDQPVRGTPLPAGTGQTRAQILGPPRWAGASSVGTVHVLPDTQCVAVISDFDDTVVQSHVTDPARLVAQTAFRNAGQLVPVPGAGAAYRAASDAGACGFFYVSGSPENLYPRIREFLTLHAIPSGPLLLKNFGTDKVFAQDEYKIGRIERLLADLPHVRFILVGDSGERDPEIYRAIARSHADRVVAIVIRTVVGSATSEERLRDMHSLPDYTGDPDVLAALVRTAAR